MFWNLGNESFPKLQRSSSDILMSDGNLLPKCAARRLMDMSRHKSSLFMELLHYILMKLIKLKEEDKVVVLI